MEPITTTKAQPRPPAKGRQADRWAAIIAALTAALAIIGSVIFFAGFVANDSYFGAVVSAFAFTVLLGAFAVGPPLIIARIAWRAYQKGATQSQAVWSFVLAAPWLALSIMLMLYTPLPVWVSGLAVLASLVLTLWALVTFILER
ncbi:hypothetical protein ACJ3XI_11525 [Litorimonas sp. RW-G-Af-16]|uniref:hypothetical protein n=1 Tax=Litorimonas sp. RW-G-Af-16 TaxID=3241168 RepID=UPI00390CB43E